MIPQATSLAARQAAVLRLAHGSAAPDDDWLAEEVPVAFEYNGVSHAVMLASPADLEDFALGFALCEGIIDVVADLRDVEVDFGPDGATLRVEIAPRCFARLKERRRSLAGRTGCGLCGAESLARALPPMPRVDTAAAPLRASAVARALACLRDGQALGRATGATHAAAWCDTAGTVRLLREDVGRHNALDKLVGALARGGIDAARGFIAVTSRASIEMVHKAAVAGAPLLVAVSAPTALAVERAAHAGLALAGFARGSDMVVYAHPERMILDSGDRN